MFLIQLLTFIDFKNGGHFNHIYEKHRGVVYGYIYTKVGDIHDTEEIVTDTFFEVWKSIDRFRGMEEQEEKSLIIKYARNNVVDFYRKKKTKVKVMPFCPEQEEEEAPYDIPDDTQNPEILLENKQDFQQLILYIDRLTDEQREVLELKYRLGMSSREISEILKITTTAVNSRVYRAKRALTGYMHVEKR